MKKWIFGKCVCLETGSSIHNYGFYPHLGVHLVFNWMKKEEQFGIYIHLILVDLYFDYFPRGY
jgi:hypothetical protein